METEVLKQFVTLAEEGNMTLAAEKLNVSQSTLSSSLHRLEKEVGVPLLDRTGKRISLNEAGEYFLSSARRILQMETIARENLQESAANSGVLKIGVLAENDSLYFLISEFQDLYPDIRIELRSEKAVMEDYEMSDLDFFVLPENLVGDLPCHRIAAQRGLFLLVREDSKYADLESVSFNDLKDELFVFDARNNGRMEKVYDECVSFGFEPKIAVVCEGLDAKLSFVLNSDLLGIAYNTMRHFRHSIHGLRAIPIIESAPEKDRSIMLTWRKEPLNPLADLLVEYVRTFRRDPKTLGV